MSIIAQLKARKVASVQQEKMMGCIAGERTLGKTTMLGTLPGKTAMLYMDMWETAYKSAAKKAAELGNILVPIKVTSPDELAKGIQELYSDDYFDNVALDSVTALTQMRGKEDDIRKMIKMGKGWAAGAEVKDSMLDYLLTLKGLSRLDTGVKKPKNVVVTIALVIKRDIAGAPVSMEMETWGHATPELVTGLCNFSGTLVKVRNEEGEAVRKLLVVDEPPFKGRADGLLDEDKPDGMVDPDFATIFNLIKGAKK